MQWTSDPLMAEGKYPEQMEWERKEQLYMEAIGFFNEGKVGVSQLTMTSHDMII